jgi:hypothetical protein
VGLDDKNVITLRPNPTKLKWFRKRQSKLWGFGGPGLIGLGKGEFHTGYYYFESKRADNEFQLSI